jgi:hypothetical protein
MAESWSPEAELAALRAAGLDQADPVRFAYLQALARRLPAQPARAQALLAERLSRPPPRCARFPRPASPPPPSAPVPAGGWAPCWRSWPRRRPRWRLRPPAPGPRLPSAGRAQPTPAAVAPVELKSVRHFRQAWKRLNAEQRLAQSRAALPQNAGPLNSQHLVHKALQQMRQLSPAYFERFVAQVDGLMWLEQALGEAAAREPASGRPGAEPGPAGQSCARAQVGGDLVQPGQHGPHQGQLLVLRRGGAAAGLGVALTQHIALGQDALAQLRGVDHPHQLHLVALVGALAGRLEAQHAEVETAQQRAFDEGHVLDVLQRDGLLDLHQDALAKAQCGLAQLALQPIEVVAGPPGAHTAQPQQRQGQADDGHGQHPGPVDHEVGAQQRVEGGAQGQGGGGGRHGGSG